jgi:hypothetical protein
MRTVGVLAIAITLLGTAAPASQDFQAGDITVPERTRIVLRLNDALSSKLNSEGDSFSAEVIVPVFVGEQLAIPKGSVVRGHVSRILRPGRFKGKAVMNLLFQSIRVPGRGSYPIVASLAKVDPRGNEGTRSEGTIVAEGSSGRDAARVLRPGLSGAGIGALAGSGRGAAIGAGVGTAIGVATVFSTRGKDVELRRGATMEIALERPLYVSAEERTSRDR